MSISIYTNQVQRYSKEISKLQSDLSREEQKESTTRREILRIQSSITKNTSESMLRSKMSQINRLENKLANIAKKKGDLIKKQADTNSKLNQAHENLRKAQLKEEQKQQRDQVRRETQMQQTITQLGRRTAELERENRLVYQPDRILSNVFVLESDTALVQGTCFHVTDIGLVTCAHVLAENLFVFHASSPADKHPVEITQSNNVLDLALISAPDLPLNDGLVLGSADSIDVLDKVILAGYPNYRIGDTGIVAVGEVTGFRMISGIRRMLIGTPIIGGNSGGPVLSRTGAVIGVAVTGADRLEEAGETEHHGVVPIDALEWLRRGNS